MEEREFFPVGGTRKKKVDIRIVSACNQDLWDMAEQGAFRKDLFFRLATIKINLPSLRERREDILPLASRLYGGIQRQVWKEISRLQPQSRKFAHQSFVAG